MCLLLIYELNIYVQPTIIVIIIVNFCFFEKIKNQFKL